MTSVHEFADAVGDEVTTVLDILVHEGWLDGEDLDDLSQETVELEAYYAMLRTSSALARPEDYLRGDPLSGPPSSA